MAPLILHSTNHACDKVDFKTALLQGLARDKGLYTPDSYPSFSRDELLSMAGLSYPELGFKVLDRLIGDQLHPEVLSRITREAYNFPVPVDHVHGRKYVLRLDKGPTASFKDFAARTMARLMDHFVSAEGRELLILTATSGDTGGAVASAFHGMKRIKVVVLFPRDEVSNRQRKQMTTLGGNVTAVAIDGKFDDCQALVKRAFADQEMRGLSLSSANSINVGRLLPQCIYYFWAWLKVTAEQVDRGELQPVAISVPSGNFGNLMGGLIAWKLGLPVKQFIAAVNENDEFPQFLKTGIYEKVEPSRNSLSNAMNVGHPSNLARIVDLFGGQMNHEGTILKMPDMKLLRRQVSSVSISDDETRRIIARVHEEHGYVLEPHGAVGWGGMMDFLARDNTGTPCISFETADPAKFPELIREILGIDPPIPPSLQAMQEKEEEYVNLRKDYDDFKKFLKTNFG